MNKRAVAVPGSNKHKQVDLTPKEIKARTAEVLIEAIEKPLRDVDQALAKSDAEIMHHCARILEDLIEHVGLNIDSGSKFARIRAERSHLRDQRTSITG